MHIWVDADACPNVIKEILYRAAQRTGIPLTLIANQYLKTPPIKNIKSLQVRAGFDVADDEIVRHAAAGDLVITSDIPLAAEVLEKGALAMSHRGKLFSPDTIKAQLNMRDFMDTMRASGINNSGGLATMNHTDRQTFANHLDQALAKHIKS